ncbi:DUF5988 family protein [Actinomadura sp. 3N508]|uniref:DUF5988 family protein n=1 Tax=Actinomadura sp. 3N508 TaxID=3375153 RepID=UPI0037B61F9D
MGNHIEVIIDGKPAAIELEGGPPDITPPTQRIYVHGNKIKLLYRAGYEHFEQVGEPESRVFRWAMRTAIAE